MDQCNSWYFALLSTHRLLMSIRSKWEDSRNINEFGTNQTPSADHVLTAAVYQLYNVEKTPSAPYETRSAEWNRDEQIRQKFAQGIQFGQFVGNSKYMASEPFTFESEEAEHSHQQKVTKNMDICHLSESLNHSCQHLDTAVIGKLVQYVCSNICFFVFNESAFLDITNSLAYICGCHVLDDLGPDFANDEETLNLMSITERKMKDIQGMSNCWKRYFSLNKFATTRYCCRSLNKSKLFYRMKTDTKVLLSALVIDRLYFISTVTDFCNIWELISSPMAHLLKACEFMRVYCGDFSGLHQGIEVDLSDEGIFRCLFHLGSNRRALLDASCHAAALIGIISFKSWYWQLCFSNTELLKAAVSYLMEFTDILRFMKSVLRRTTVNGLSHNHLCPTDIIRAIIDVTVMARDALLLVIQQTLFSSEAVVNDICYNSFSEDSSASQITCQLRKDSLVARIESLRSLRDAISPIFLLRLLKEMQTICGDDFYGCYCSKMFSGFCRQDSSVTNSLAFALKEVTESLDSIRKCALGVHKNEGLNEKVLVGGPIEGVSYAHISESSAKADVAWGQLCINSDSCMGNPDALDVLEGCRECGCMNSLALEATRQIFEVRTRIAGLYRRLIRYYKREFKMNYSGFEIMDLSTVFPDDLQTCLVPVSDCVKMGNNNYTDYLNEMKTGTVIYHGEGSEKFCSFVKYNEKVEKVALLKGWVSQLPKYGKNSRLKGEMWIIPLYLEDGLRKISAALNLRLGESLHVRKRRAKFKAIKSSRYRLSATSSPPEQLEEFDNVSVYKWAKTSRLIMSFCRRLTSVLCVFEGMTLDEPELRALASILQRIPILIVECITSLGIPKAILEKTGCRSNLTSDLSSTKLFVHESHCCSVPMAVERLETADISELRTLTFYFREKGKYGKCLSAAICHLIAETATLACNLLCKSETHIRQGLVVLRALGCCGFCGQNDRRQNISFSLGFWISSILSPDGLGTVGFEAISALGKEPSPLLFRSFVAENSEFSEAYLHIDSAKEMQVWEVLQFQCLCFVSASLRLVTKVATEEQVRGRILNFREMFTFEEKNAKSFNTGGAESRQIPKRRMNLSDRNNEFTERLNRPPAKWKDTAYAEKSIYYIGYIARILRFFLCPIHGSLIHLMLSKHFNVCLVDPVDERNDVLVGYKNISMTGQFNTATEKADERFASLGEWFIRNDGGLLSSSGERSASVTGELCQNLRTSREISSQCTRCGGGGCRTKEDECGSLERVEFTVHALACIEVLRIGLLVLQMPENLTEFFSFFDQLLGLHFAIHQRAYLCWYAFCRHNVIDLLTEGKQLRQNEINSFMYNRKIPDYYREFRYNSQDNEHEGSRFGDHVDNNICPLFFARLHLYALLLICSRTQSLCRLDGTELLTIITQQLNITAKAAHPLFEAEKGVFAAKRLNEREESIDPVTGNPQSDCSCSSFSSDRSSEPIKAKMDQSVCISSSERFDTNKTTQKVNPFIPRLNLSACPPPSPFRVIPVCDEFLLAPHASKNVVQVGQDAFTYSTEGRIGEQDVFDRDSQLYESHDPIHTVSQEETIACINHNSFEDDEKLNWNSEDEEKQKRNLAASVLLFESNNKGNGLHSEVSTSFKFLKEKFVKETQQECATGHGNSFYILQNDEKDLEDGRSRTQSEQGNDGKCFQYTAGPSVISLWEFFHILGTGLQANEHCDSILEVKSATNQSAGLSHAVKHPLSNQQNMAYVNNFELPSSIECVLDSSDCIAKSVWWITPAYALSDLIDFMFGGSKPQPLQHDIQLHALAVALILVLSLRDSNVMPEDAGSADDTYLDSTVTSLELRQECFRNGLINSILSCRTFLIYWCHRRKINLFRFQLYFNKTGARLNHIQDKYIEVTENLISCLQVHLAHISRCCAFTQDDLSHLPSRQRWPGLSCVVDCCVCSQRMQFFWLLVSLTRKCGDSSSRLLKLVATGGSSHEVYMHQEKLGAGSYGCVWSAYCDLSDESVAFKEVIAPVDEKAPVRLARIYQEISCLEFLRLSVPLVCEILDFGIIESFGCLSYFIIMRRYSCNLKEWMHRLKETSNHEGLCGTLNGGGTFLHHNGDNNSTYMSFRGLPLILGIFGQILTAVNAMHAKGIVHCDLKCENIFLDFDRFIPFPMGTSCEKGHSKTSCAHSILNASKLSSEISSNVLQGYDFPGGFCSQRYELIPTIAVGDFGEAFIITKNRKICQFSCRGTEINKSPEQLNLHNFGKHFIYEDSGYAYDWSDKESVNCKNVLASSSMPKAGDSQPQSLFPLSESLKEFRGLPGAACDIWALGCLFYELLTGKHLFAGDPLIYRRFTGDEPLIDAFHEKSLLKHEGLISFLRSLLVLRWNKRPSASEALVLFENLYFSILEEIETGKLSVRSDFPLPIHKYHRLGLATHAPCVLDTSVWKQGIFSLGSMWAFKNPQRVNDLLKSVKIEAGSIPIINGFVEGIMDQSISRTALDVPCKAADGMEKMRENYDIQANDLIYSSLKSIEKGLENRRADEAGSPDQCMRASECWRSTHFLPYQRNHQTCNGDSALSDCATARWPCMGPLQLLRHIFVAVAPLSLPINQIMLLLQRNATIAYRGSGFNDSTDVCTDDMGKYNLVQPEYFNVGTIPFLYQHNFLYVIDIRFFGIQTIKAFPLELRKCVVRRKKERIESSSGLNDKWLNILELSLLPIAQTYDIVTVHSSKFDVITQKTNIMVGDICKLFAYVIPKVFDFLREASTAMAKVLLLQSSTDMSVCLHPQSDRNFCCDSNYRGNISQKAPQWEINEHRCNNGSEVSGGSQGRQNALTSASSFKTSSTDGWLYAPLTGIAAALAVVIVMESFRFDHLRAVTMLSTLCLPCNIPSTLLPTLKDFGEIRARYVWLGQREWAVGKSLSQSNSLTPYEKAFKLNSCPISDINFNRRTSEIKEPDFFSFSSPKTRCCQSTCYQSKRSSLIQDHINEASFSTASLKKIGCLCGACSWVLPSQFSVHEGTDTIGWNTFNKRSFFGSGTTDCDGVTKQNIRSSGKHTVLNHKYIGRRRYSLETASICCRKSGSDDDSNISEFQEDHGCPLAKRCRKYVLYLKNRYGLLIEGLEWVVVKLVDSEADIHTGNQNILQGKVSNFSDFSTEADGCDLQNEDEESLIHIFAGGARGQFLDVSEEEAGFIWLSDGPLVNGEEIILDDEQRYERYESSYCSAGNEYIATAENSSLLNKSMAYNTSRKWRIFRCRFCGVIAFAIARGSCSTVAVLTLSFDNEDSLF